MKLPYMFRNILDSIQYNQTLLDELKNIDNIESVEIPEAKQILYMFYNYFNTVGWEAKKSLPCRTLGKVIHKEAIYPINKFTIQKYAFRKLNAKDISKILNVPSIIIKSHMTEWGYVYKDGQWVKREVFI